MSPDEWELRGHFGDLLPKDTKLMQPRHTQIWAIDDGTLLWDPKNGYAKFEPKPKGLIYLTGAQDSGKAGLLAKIPKAVEVNCADRESIAKEIEKYAGKYENIVFTSQKRHGSTLNAIKKESERLGLEFININCLKTLY